MDHDKLIKGTNRVALYGTAALVYWVFIFLIITAFDLKIFRERMTEVFYLSILGIFAILGGAIILNVMSNLSKISTVLASERSYQAAAARPSKTAILLIVISFPVIAAVLFAGNHLSAVKKKNTLVASARTLMADRRDELAALADYSFSSAYVKKAEKTLGVIEKIDKHFPQIVLIRADKIENKQVLLGFGRHISWEEKKPVEKAMFIYSASQEERAYLTRVFAGEEKNFRFTSHKGDYELYFPVTVNGATMVLFFSDYQQYGKFGS